MGASLTFVTVSSLSTLFLIILFVIEDHRGNRFGERVRSVFDRMLANMNASIRHSLPDLNDHFFREVFHFLVHGLLALVLSVIRRLERGVLKIVRFNRMQVMRLRSVKPAAEQTSDRSSHLAEVMDHKRATELTPKEKAKRKEDAIHG